MQSQTHLMIIFKYGNAIQYIKKFKSNLLPPFLKHKYGNLKEDDQSRIFTLLNKC